MKIKDYMKAMGIRGMSEAAARIVGLDWPLRSGWGNKQMPPVESGLDERFKAASLRKKGKHTYQPKKKREIGKETPDLSNRFPTSREWSDIVARKKKAANDRFFNSEEWRTIRYKVIELCQGRCVACGRSYREDGCKMHVDHIIPRSIQPELELKLDNLQLLCADCNLGKGNRYDTDWRPFRK